jgi:hypothetical protein
MKAIDTGVTLNLNERRPVPRFRATVTGDETLCQPVL